ncbi:MAG: peptidase C1, partial [Fimbriimonadaceae bacterium]|nr:peptidase C1 [Chitinophagales bacterium]
MKKLTSFFIATLSVTFLFAQQPDKAEYRQPGANYYNDVIIPDINKNETPADVADKRTFKIDASAVKAPKDPAVYKQVWHNDPVSQGNTGTCWCFSTTSFFESEIKKASNIEIKLSEMYIVYWQYVERAKYFVAHRGDMYFGEGSETNGATWMIKDYGIVPYDIYKGKTSAASFYNHEKLLAEMDNYLKNVKATNNWNETEVVNTIKSILNYY